MCTQSAVLARPTPARLSADKAADPKVLKEPLSGVIADLLATQ